MKTTLNLRDDLVRRAKARAALRGQPLARYIEDGLEERLLRDESEPATIVDWVESLPRLSAAAAKELDTAISDPSFREVDTEMWQ